LIPRRLKRKGFEVDIARTGCEGIKMALSGYPDLILIDIDLPIKEGQTAIKELKAAEQSHSIPIIALTRSDSEIEQAKAAGCDDYEPEPVELARLLEKINKLLSTQDNA
jgi:DNA-binding response OmpR family regulator